MDLGRARTVAIEWMVALKRQQIELLESRTSIPFLAIGFDVGNIPERKDCGMDTGLRMEMSFDARDSAELRRLFRCLAIDGYLEDGTPTYATDSWPTEPPAGVELDAQGRPGGYLYNLRLDSVPDRLKRYRATLQTLSATSALIGFLVTDGGGISAAGVLAVRIDGRDLKVSHLLMDEKFEE